MEKEEKMTITVIKTIGKSFIAAIPVILIAAASLLLANVATEKNKRAQFLESLMV